MECLKVFDPKFQNIIEKSVKSVLLENSDNIESETNKNADWLAQQQKSENSLTCSYCRIEFENSQLQRNHYKLDWHRYNLKQSLLNKKPISEEEFDEITKKDDLSSISGSDSGEKYKEETLDTYATAQGKIFLQNDAGTVFSIYRCLIFDRKEESSEKILLNRLKTCCVQNKKWTILMIGGGHFAGAVFNNEEAILHKTFHCYTVRAGQGGSQSARDSKSGGSHPKSAGASLRRYNEQGLVDHVRSIIDAWKTEIAQSSIIFYRASGPYNRGVLFGGNPPILERNDSRLRTIPFSTRRATFTELKRVHSLLCQANIYDNLEAAADKFAKQKSPDESKRSKVRSVQIIRDKSRETVERPLPGKLSTSSSSDESHLEDLVKAVVNLDLSFHDVEVDFTDLQEFDDSLTPEQRKQHRKKKPKKSKAKKLKEKEEARKKELINVLCKGDLVKLKTLADNYVKSSMEVEENSGQAKNEFFNEVLDEDSNTLLHLAAMNEHYDLVFYLLENEANPCLKNKSNKTVYTVTQNRDIREGLKEFARENPHKYNYNKAQIPINSLTNDELAERKKAQRKVKREKEKEKRKEKVIQQQENQDKDRFLQLSDREKRALAAEKRILSQSGTVTSRCFLCASDMSGKVPFEYLGNRFCTIDCLKAHRLSNPASLS